MVSNYALPSNTPSTSTGNVWLDYYSQLAQGALSPQTGNVWSNFMNSLPGGWEQAYYTLEQDPQAAYEAFTNLNSQGQGNVYQNWLKGQYNKYYGQYNAASASNPSLMWTQFLGGMNPQQDYSMDDPYNRGGYFHQAGIYSPTQAMRY